MDRGIVFAGQVPLDTDILYPQASAMKALGALMRAVVGTGTVFDGLAVTETTVPSMSVSVGPGSLMAMSTVDPSAYGSLGTEANALMKAGIRLAAGNVGPFTAPGTSGQSVNILIQAAFSETDASPVVLSYYNAANPAAPFLGPGNSGTAQNTRRVQTIIVAGKVGTPATTGSQTTPAPDAGYVGVAVVTIANGATSIVNANISDLPTAPKLRVPLSEVQPMPAPVAYGTAGSYTYTVPVGVTRLRVRATGGGGGGGGNTTSGGAGGGGGGGYAEGIIAVTPGQAVSVTVGAAGTAGTNAGGSAAANSGGNGGNSSVSGSGFTTITTAGGTGGEGSMTAGQGSSGPGGAGTGASLLNARGGNGNAGLNANGGFGGPGGAAANGGGGGASSTGLPSAGGFPGGGGAGGGGGFAGAAGAAGWVCIEPMGRA